MGCSSTDGRGSSRALPLLGFAKVQHPSARNGAGACESPPSTSAMRVRSDSHQTRSLRALQSTGRSSGRFRAPRCRGQPDHLRLPSLSFLPTSTACSAHHRAGLLHPAADPGVRPVSRAWQPTGAGTWGSAMPTAVLPPGILSQGRRTLRSVSPVRSHPPAKARSKPQPLPSLTPASPTFLLLSGQPDHSGPPRLASRPFTVGLPLSPLQSRLCSPPLPKLFRADIRGAPGATTRPQGLAPRTDPLHRQGVAASPVPDASMGFLLCTHRPRGPAPPRRPAPRSREVDRLQRFCCVTSVAKRSHPGPT